jgi:hypothetical protein
LHLREQAKRVLTKRVHFVAIGVEELVGGDVGLKFECAWFGVGKGNVERVVEARKRREVGERRRRRRKGEDDKEGDEGKKNKKKACSG